MPQTSSPPDEPLPPSLRRSADRLATSLAACNRAVYRRALAQHAAALGAKTPRHVQSASVKEAIAARARVSADSLTRTHLAARRRFYEQTGSVPKAKELYKQWTEQRAGVVAAFEAGMTATSAARDFAQRNQDVIEGQEWVEPEESSGDEACADAISRGRQPIGTIDPPPYHPHCVHALARDYQPLSDPAALWVGGPDQEDEEERNDDR